MFLAAISFLLPFFEYIWVVLNSKVPEKSKKYIPSSLNFFVPFISILNLHFWHYYVPHALMWGNPPSTYSTRLLLIDFPLHSISQFPFLTFLGEGKHNKRKGAHVPWARSAPQSTHPCDIALQPTSHLSPAKKSAKQMPQHFCVTACLWSNFLLEFREIISPCTHLALLFLLPWPILVVVPPQYSDPFSWGSKGNARDIPKLMVIKQSRVEAGWP